MATISVVISAFNEEAKIADCLESVVFADEVILVDNSSTDKTAQIAKKYILKVFKQPNNPTMLNINKNFGIGKATGDWILYLDADERVSPELAKEILSVVSRPPAGEAGQSLVVGYWIPRKNIIFGKWISHTGMSPDYQMRLFKKGKGKFPQRHVHEMIDVVGTTGYLQEHLLHYNFETVSQFLYKHIELYAPNEADALLKKGYTFTPYDALGFPFGEFLSRFFAREGYKDGLHGLVLSLLFAFYHLVIFVRIWEKKGFKEHNATNFLDRVSAQLRKSFGEISYWIANEKLKRSKSILEQTMLKVQRKLKS